MEEKLGAPKYFDNIAFQELRNAGAYAIMYYLHEIRELSGLFEISRSLMHYDTATTADDFNTLVDAGFVKWCPEHSVVWIVDGLAQHIIKPIAAAWKRINTQLETYHTCHLASELCAHNRPVWGEKLRDPCPELADPDQYTMTGLLGATRKARTTRAEAIEHHKKEGCDTWLYWRSVSQGVVTYGEEMAAICKQLHRGDVEVLDEVFVDLLSRKNGKPRALEAQEKFFEQALRYPAKQVAIAAGNYIDQEIAEKGLLKPDKYFFGMVRGAKGEYQKWAQGEEIRLEQKRKQERIREAARRNKEALRGADREGGQTGPRPIGALLREL